MEDTMLNRITSFLLVCSVGPLVFFAVDSAQANWLDTFESGQPNATWIFGSYPAVTGTFTQTIKTAPDGNKYLSVDETTPFNPGAGSLGSVFGLGFGSDEDFTDMRVGSVVNVVGDNDDVRFGLAARATYIIDPDGSITKEAPGMLANAYIMMIHLQDGPTRFRIEILKTYMNQEDVVMANYHEESIPGIGHDGSYYAELDVVGSNPAYITASLYEYEGGPLVGRTTRIDTNGQDSWEDPGPWTGVYAAGKGGIWGTNVQTDSAVYHVTFDDVSATDGPSAINPSPADGEGNVSVDAVLGWTEANSATSREVWLGRPGKLEKVSTTAGPGSFDPGTLEFGRTYQWRVDQVGPSGVVEGRLWTFTTAPCAIIDDFELYASDAAIQTAWPHNIPGWNYIFVAKASANVKSGSQAMRYEYQNQAEPFFTIATKTLPAAQDWTGFASVSLAFKGDEDNYEQPLSIKLEDSLGGSGIVQNPHRHAPQTESWVSWSVALQEFADAGVNLSAVSKISLQMGDGTNSGQPVNDIDTLFIDDLWLCPLRCFNTEGVDLSGDVNGDCVVDFRDFADICSSWLNSGLSALP